MKKFIITIVLAAAAMNINAQLMVDSLGHVGVGRESPWANALLSIGSYGNSDYDAAIHCSVRGNTYGAYFLNHTDYEHGVYGAYFNAKNNFNTSIGARGVAHGGNDASVHQSVIGLSGAGGEGYSAAGILGGRIKAEDITVKFAGVYGTEYATNYLVFGNYSGSYAGFFRGKARVTDGLYATLLTPAASAAPSEQSGTAALSDRGENVSDKLSQVQAVQFLRQGLKPTEEEADQEKEEGIKAESQLSPVQYGLDAEQLKAVYPELVYEDANGNVSINYVEMVPLLVQSINELKAELAELKGTSARKAKAETTGIEDNVSDVDMVRMDQNKPNPFSESTVITLNIPAEVQTASIFIYDMSGKQVQSLPVTERGETDITVYASDLTAGMYIYTLVVDGKVTVTRRMIVSEK